MQNILDETRTWLVNCGIMITELNLTLNSRKLNGLIIYWDYQIYFYAQNSKDTCMGEYRRQSHREIVRTPSEAEWDHRDLRWHRLRRISS